MNSSKDWIDIYLSKDASKIYNQFILPHNQLAINTVFNILIVFTIALAYMETVTVSCI